MQLSISETAAALNQLALRGQVIYDLQAAAYRWRQVLPMALSDREVGPPHAEFVGARQLIRERLVVVESQDDAPRGGVVVVGKVEGKPCEAMINGDGMVRKGRCVCGWHFKFGIRNGPCRHIQALRDTVWIEQGSTGEDWYTSRLHWAGQT